MVDAGKIVRLFAALGADDPEGWARSETEESIPQLARYRLLRALWQDIEAWDSAAIRSLRDDAHGEGAAAVGRALALGISAEDLSHMARLVARETAFSLLYRLADPDSDDLPAGLGGQLPGWTLVETAPDGTPTQRPLDALYEDLNTAVQVGAGMSRTTVAEGWIWEANARPFCESLAAEIGYDFDDSDWQAIASSLPDTDDEQPQESWYMYPLVGRNRLDLRMARAVGGSEVSIKVEGAVSSNLHNRIGALLDVMSRYTIRTGVTARPSREACTHRCDPCT